MTVSIIVPVYNVEDYLRKCIYTITNQTYTDIEIILVDDGSTDSSGIICDEVALLDSRIKVIHKKNGGLSDARNAGIQIANGEWLTFIDSDDYVTNDYIEYLLNLIIENDADISIATYTYVSEKKEITHANDELVVMNDEEAIKRMLLNTGFDMGTWSKMYRTEYFSNISFPVGKLFEDSLTTYQILSKASKIVFSSKSIYYYVNRSNSIVNDSFNVKKFDLIEMNQLNEKFINKTYPNLKDEVKRRVIWSYFSTLNQVVTSNDKTVIKKYAPELKEYITSNGKFIINKSFVPMRDKVAYLALRLFGIAGYAKIWKIYLKIFK